MSKGTHTHTPSVAGWTLIFTTFLLHTGSFLAITSASCCGDDVHVINVLCPTETGALQRLFGLAGSGEKGNASQLMAIALVISTRCVRLRMSEWAPVCVCVCVSTANLTFPTSKLHDILGGQLGLHAQAPFGVAVTYTFFFLRLSHCLLTPPSSLTPINQPPDGRNHSW